MTEARRQQTAPDARCLFVWSATGGAALFELLLWQLAGREGEVAAVLAFALVAGGLAAGFAWISARWLGKHLAETAALSVVFLPYGFHAYAMSGWAEGFALPFAGLLALMLAALVSWLSSLARVRALAHAWVFVGGLLLAMMEAMNSDRPPLAAPNAYPDVVLIVMDTTRRDHLSLYGYDKPTTPALERFAKRAEIYEDAWSTAPWTPSSHASMFTGLFPAEHGVDGIQLPSFPPGIASLPEILESAGFHTAGFVANPNLLGSGWERGFAQYSPAWFEGPHSLVPVLNWILMRGVPVWLDERSSDRVLDSARKWWDRNDDAPRFLFLNLIDPHDPYRPPESERARFLPNLTRSESFAIQQDPQHYAIERGLPEETRRVISALYDAEIAALDRRLGTFFNWLADRGELEDSLIVVTADHGERLGEKGMLGHLLLMDQHLLRVPLVLRFPGRREPATIEERVQLSGIPGEILELIGVESTAVLAERRLSAQVERARSELASPDYAIGQHRYFGWYVSQLRSRQPVFDDTQYRGSWTLVADRERALLWSPSRPEAAGRMVAVEGDPDWQVDLWDAEPETRERLLAKARAQPRFGDEREAPGAEQPEGEIDAALRERLRALGYAD